MWYIKVESAENTPYIVLIVKFIFTNEIVEKSEQAHIASSQN